MAVIETISVGNVQYYLTDTIPTHTANKGSVSLVQEDGYTPEMYLNNDGGTTWVKLYVQIHGSMNFTGETSNTNTLGTDTIDSWYQMAQRGTWVAGDGTNLTADGGSSLDYSGFNQTQLASSNAGAVVTGGLMNTFGKAICLFKSHYKFTTDAKWNDIEVGINIHNLVPNRYQGTTIKSTGAIGGIKSYRIEDFPRGAWISGTYSYTGREGGGGSPASKAYIPTDAQIHVMTLDSLRYRTLFTEDWSEGSFSGSGWTLVNDTTNQWVIGSAESVSGGQCAYISNDGGTTAAYTQNVNDVSHFYRDILIPSGATYASLEFDWKCWGENSTAAGNYDYCAVVMTGTTGGPVANVELTTTEATNNNALPYPTPEGDGRIGANRNLTGTGQFGKYNEGFGGSNSFWRPESIDLSNYIGIQKRLVFSWHDDTTGGADPSMCIDNIKIIYY